MSWEKLKVRFKWINKKDTCFRQWWWGPWILLFKHLWVSATNMYIKMTSPLWHYADHPITILVLSNLLKEEGFVELGQTQPPSCHWHVLSSQTPEPKAVEDKCDFTWRRSSCGGRSSCKDVHLPSGSWWAGAADRGRTENTWMIGVRGDSQHSHLHGRECTHTHSAINC